MKIFMTMLLSAGLAFGAIDINKANATEFQTLKGVGATKAKAIVAYRDETCFENIDALADVKGIGIKTIDKNRDNLTASKCKTTN